MKTFEELGVSPEIRRAIEEMGYENPMPVQEEVIIVQISCYLETKLTSRAEDKRLWNSVLYVNLLEQGQAECGCFTCLRLSSAEKTLPQKSAGVSATPYP
mgnify:CR=1 FL=1